eukprot:18422-Alexandrium_andersonii.AAC.1
MTAGWAADGRAPLKLTAWRAAPHCALHSGRHFSQQGCRWPRATQTDNAAARATYAHDQRRPHCTLC